jgi:hypothetical protein
MTDSSGERCSPKYTRRRSRPIAACHQQLICNGVQEFPKIGFDLIQTRQFSIQIVRQPTYTLGLFELNEAFAAQVLACVKAAGSDQLGREKLGLPGALGEIRLDTLNVNGGAIALGHPVGTTGSRLVLTLMKEMRRRKVQFGIATLCIGGGQGGAMILESEA